MLNIPIASNRIWSLILLFHKIWLKGVYNFYRIVDEERKSPSLYVGRYNVMKITTILGLIAATLTTLSFIPQVVKIWRMKETRDISLSMFVMLAVGIVLWTIYGFIIQDLPVILANCVSFILTAIIIFFKIKYR